MTEPVRLVIWDLDETFWRGTVTEGGHAYVPAHHDIVVELARRGIMSAICSKNDAGVVRPILQAAGIWDYFIFPSINWEPKGPRIAALIEDVQLRPGSVLFVDDNPMNLAEAQHFVPGLQVADERFIAEMLASPLFKGKNDAALTRLAQYKVLERRKADEAVAAAASGGSNVGFLRGSNIRVRIERNIEAHLDRAIELINRTNQLNFTKMRLPEAPDAAAAELRRILGHHLVQAGLVEVSDNYGNYGFCGLYVTKTGAEATKLLHFCFSCRILNMGVEAWLYQNLGRPQLRVRGQVLSDPVGAAPVDWITRIEAADADQPKVETQPGALSSVAARGGCVLMPLTHYFTMHAGRVVGEYNTMRNGIAIRLDHSLVFRHALDGVSEAELAALAPLGFAREDFVTRYFEHEGPNPVWIFSNWADLGIAIYKHRATGVRIPYRPAPEGKRRTPPMEVADAYLRDAYEPVGVMGKTEMQDCLRAVFSRVPAHGRLFALLALERAIVDGAARVMNKRVEQNAWTAEVAAEFANVTTLYMGDFVEDDSEIASNSAGGHFDRMVYFRIYQEILRLVTPAAVAAA